jgi:hypothetical protein
MAMIVQRTMFMVILALSMAFLYFPLVIGLNIYCVTRMVDREFRPGRFNLTLTVVGMIMGLTGLVLLVRVLKILN